MRDSGLPDAVEDHDQPPFLTGGNHMTDTDEPTQQPATVLDTPSLLDG